MFKCSYMDWDTRTWKHFIVKSKRKLESRWEIMYNDVVAGHPLALLIVQPTMAGVYTLERI